MNPPITPTIPPPMNPMPTSRSFVSLPPEILRMIFLAVDPPDRTRCCRLNKYLNSVAAPLLWQWVKPNSLKQIRRLCTRDAQRAFTRNTAHVRHLYLTREAFSLFLPRKKTSTTCLDCSSSSSSSSAWSRQKTPSDLYLPGVFTNLRYLTLGPGLGQDDIIDYYRSRYTFTQEEEDALVAFLRQNTTLTNVAINQDDMHIDALLRITTQEELLSNLTRLRVGPYLTTWTAKVLLEGLPESIRRAREHDFEIWGHCRIDRCRDPDRTMNPVMSGADFIQLDWASTSLTVWNCMIMVPRPNGGEEEEDGLANNETESHSIQRQVCQKLAQQTKLRELKLGLLGGGQVPQHESRHQTQCLE
ncbi:hypothetical protein BGZ82_003427 [Podila clonocystis]|nr:hypothetical protein BGZ82_003427 [Podila clonocystis]